MAALRLPRAVGLIRVGRPGSFAAAVQEVAIEQFAAGQGVAIVRLIVELDGDSAPIDERVGLQDALNAVTTGEASVVVVADASQLTPSAQELQRFITKVERAGGTFLGDDAGLVGYA